MKKAKVLSEHYVSQLYKIFERKNWKTNEHGEYSVFDRFCSRLAELETDEDRDLVIELTSDFLWVSLNMYEEYLLEAFKRMFESKSWNLEEDKKIYICPLLPERDFGKIKSSALMLYLCQNILIRTFSVFQEEQIRICETPEILEVHKDEIGALILIDDFIGSGETALECIEYLESLESLKIVDKKIYIVSLVAQEEGINTIYKKYSANIQIFAAVIRKKGISDSYPEPEATEKLERMRNISKKLKVQEKLNLGYNSSQSLVAMIKTPNNTFPVYWYENKTHKYAPFPRKENIKMIRS